jgi:hypothetical protein
MEMTPCALRAPDRAAIFVEGLEHLASKVDPLRHLHSQVAGHEWRLSLELHVVDIAGAIRPPDLEDIAEATGGDQSGLDPLVLNEHVGDDGGAIDQLIQLRGRSD